MKNINIQFHPTGIFKASTRCPDCLQKFLKFKVELLSFFDFEDRLNRDTYDFQEEWYNF